MSRFSALMRTTAARLSALYLLLFAVGAVALVFYMTNLSASIVAGQTQQALAEEVASIGKSYARGGIPQLVRTIGYRSRQPGAYLYLVADPTGRILAGNVQSVQPGVLDTDGIVEKSFTYQRYGERGSETEHRAIAVVIALPNGMKLLVGRDLGEPERFRDIVRRSLMLALGIMSVGAFLIWFFVGRRALKRIDEVSRASQRIMDGDLTGRLPVNGSGDEFDRLSVNLNMMLGRILDLNEGLRQVSDNIAHDLRTPLTRLRNRAEEALSGRKAGPEYRAALDDIIGDARTLEHGDTVRHRMRLDRRTIVRANVDIDAEHLSARLQHIHCGAAFDSIGHVEQSQKGCAENQGPTMGYAGLDNEIRAGFPDDLLHGHDILRILDDGPSHPEIIVGILELDRTPQKTGGQFLHFGIRAYMRYTICGFSFERGWVAHVSSIFAGVGNASFGKKRNTFGLKQPFGPVPCRW